MTCVDLQRMSDEEFKQRYTVLGYIYLDTFHFQNIQKMVNTATNQIVVMKSSGNNLDEEEGMEVDNEIATICRFQNFESLRVYTDSLIRILEFGIKDWPEDEFAGDMFLGSDLFYTMPLYERVIPENLDSHQQLDFVFELLVAVVVLNLSGIIHHDLHEGNILIEKVNYHRQYSINGQTYLCKFEYIPIIIDFGLAEINDEPSLDLSMEYRPFAGYNDDSSTLATLIMDPKIVQPLVIKLRASKSFDILLHPVFKPLTLNPIQVGDTIKVFAPLEI